jgi:hypothetical protein
MDISAYNTNFTVKILYNSKPFVSTHETTINWVHPYNKGEYSPCTGYGALNSKVYIFFTNV